LRIAIMAFHMELSRALTAMPEGLLNLLDVDLLEVIEVIGYSREAKNLKYLFSFKVFSKS